MTMRALIFVHGIRSDCSVFAKLKRSLKEDSELVNWRQFDCDYDWGYGVGAGASRLHDVLDDAESWTPGGELFIVAHSMGGLVARATLMERPRSAVKRLIMIATPNFGAISTAELLLQFQPLADAVGALNGVYPRQRAFYDLTHVEELFANHERANTQLGTEYATVPAMYYHIGRKVFGAGALSKDQRMYTGLVLTAEILRDAFPSRPALSRPHDGIVMEKKVALLQRDGWTEKWDAITAPSAVPRTYVHVVSTRARQLNHSTILGDETLIQIFKELLLCDSIHNWIVKPGRKGVNVETRIDRA